jgi:hypothetical protein
MFFGKEPLLMSLEVEDPRDLFLSSIDFAACRIELSDTPIVLLCGGKVKTKEHPDAETPPIGSLRDAISRAHTTFEVFRPEEIESWQSDGVFKDLLSFEKELASICSLVVIILESEGALVELGAFSQLTELSEKIIAICPSAHRTTNSFINLGILRFISEKKTSSVKSYPWETKNPNSITGEVISDAVTDITEELSSLSKTEVLKASQNSHLIVMICELLKMFAALKESELLFYLKRIGFSLSSSELKGKLFLLKSFRLIKIQDYSDSWFYMRTSENYHKVRIAMKDKSEKFDSLRTEIQILEFYDKNDQKHRNRLRAIRLAKNGAAR